MLPSLGDFSIRLTGVLIVLFNDRVRVLGKSGKMQHLFVTQLYKNVCLRGHFNCSRIVIVS